MFQYEPQQSFSYSRYDDDVVIMLLEVRKMDRSLEYLMKI